MAYESFPSTRSPIVPHKTLLQSRPRASLLPPTRPSAALLCESRWPKNHTEDNAVSAAALRGSDLEDARLVLTAVGPCPPWTIAGWPIVPEWVPCASGSMSWSAPFPESGAVKAVDLTQEDLETARQLRSAFRALPPPDRDHFRVALDRLNRALRRVLVVDRAIELGIALEFLFLKDAESGSELAFQMPERPDISDAILTARPDLRLRARTL